MRPFFPSEDELKKMTAEQLDAFADAILAECGETLNRIAESYGSRLWSVAQVWSEKTGKDPTPVQFFQGEYKSRCRGCNKEIFWGKTATSSVIPLDASAPCYRFDPESGTAARTTGVHVNHFSTCSKANQFHRRKEGGKP